MHTALGLDVRIPCKVPEWQVSSLEQVCTSSLPPVSMLEDLDIYVNRYGGPRWQGDVENALWLELLRPFAAVKNLYLQEGFVPHCARPARACRWEIVDRQKFCTPWRIFSWRGFSRRDLSMMA
jgi:hypothetical protein